MTKRKVEELELEDIFDDNQIRVKLDSLKKQAVVAEPEFVQASSGHSILNKLILLALPSPSQQIH